MSLFSCKEIDTLAETMTGCLQGAVERVRVEDSVLREALNLLYQTSHVLHSLVPIFRVKYDHLSQTNKPRNPDLQIRPWIRVRGARCISRSSESLSSYRISC